MVLLQPILIYSKCGKLSANHDIISAVFSFWKVHCTTRRCIENLCMPLQKSTKQKRSMWMCRKKGQYVLLEALNNSKFSVRAQSVRKHRNCFFCTLSTVSFWKKLGWEWHIISSSQVYGGHMHAVKNIFPVHVQDRDRNEWRQKYEMFSWVNIWQVWRRDCANE